MCLLSRKDASIWTFDPLSRSAHCVFGCAMKQFASCHNSPRRSSVVTEGLNRTASRNLIASINRDGSKTEHSERDHRCCTQTGAHHLPSLTTGRPAKKLRTQGMNRATTSSWKPSFVNTPESRLRPNPQTNLTPAAALPGGVPRSTLLSSVSSATNCFGLWFSSRNSRSP
jgi:hypothetical protein